MKETGLDPRIEAIQNAGRVYAEQQNHGVDQELWDKFGTAPLKVEGGSYDEFVAKVEQNTMHETIYTDSEGRTIVVIVMEDLFNHFEFRKHGGGE